MKPNEADLEVFVLTYNRSSFLHQTLTSLCNQTLSGFRIVVLDNGSTDDTPEIVKIFEPCGVELNRSERNLGGLENFKRAQKLASRSWVMVFHDDDLLHPAYIEVAMDLINKYKNVVLVESAMSFEENPTNDYWPNVSTDIVCCKKPSDIAALFYRGLPLHFASAIYRTDLFKQTFVEWETYGKVGDRPFLLDIAKQGTTVVLKEPYVKYRCHPGQDCVDSKTGPFIHQLIALHRKYYQLLGCNPLVSSGRVFLANNYKQLCNEYGNLIEKHQLTQKEYIKRAMQEDASTKSAILYGWFKKRTCDRVFTILIKIKRVIVRGENKWQSRNLL